MAQELDAATQLSLPMPRGPILSWSSIAAATVPKLSCVENLSHIAFTTSGRAAIHQALLQLRLPPNSTVLVPSYHCPTMIAPVVLAGFRLAFFGLRDDGRPNLDTIDAATASTCSAMLVSHYFGLSRSLAEVRKWCDVHGVALVEDCAHSYFGQAGERSIGAWGDYSTASISKFFPVPEGGLLGSSCHPIPNLRLTSPNIKAEIKGWVDVLETATKYKGFPGLNSILDFVFRLKNWRPRPDLNTHDATIQTNETIMRDCDMKRVTQAPLWASMALKTILPRGRIILRRQQNYASYERHFAEAQGARPLFRLGKESIAQTAPYVFPLWVDDADHVYHVLRELELPVFRWDRIWPGTPHLDNDVGPLWNLHVLQLLCHQDLSVADIDRTAGTILRLLRS